MHLLKLGQVSKAQSEAINAINFCYIAVYSQLYVSEQIRQNLSFCDPNRQRQMHLFYVFDKVYANNVILI